MATYNPSYEVAVVLRRALDHVNSVQYGVTARWVFYRLLQDGTLQEKGDYKRLLSYLSKARKRFYGGWHPSTLTDDTRRAIVNGGGFDDGNHWLRAIRRQTECSLDKWTGQENYVEIWFEASAMSSQFAFHAHEHIPLLAFHGDVSIPAKWNAAQRIAERWLELHIPVKVLYYGDLDEKGLTIPISASNDVYDFVAHAMYAEIRRTAPSKEEADDRIQEEFTAFSEGWEFIRMGLNEDQIDAYNVPENPERPGTYQWEGLEDADAEAMIDQALVYLNQDAFDEAEANGQDVTDRFRDHLDDLDLSA